jgi:hypothetical protein
VAEATVDSYVGHLYNLVNITEEERRALRWFVNESVKGLFAKLPTEDPRVHVVVQLMATLDSPEDGNTYGAPAGNYLELLHKLAAMGAEHDEV